VEEVDRAQIEEMELRLIYRSRICWKNRMEETEEEKEKRYGRQKKIKKASRACDKGKGINMRQQRQK
jgi:hypothetical protein